jgi:hypothetical protein
MAAGIDTRQRAGWQGRQRRQRRTARQKTLPGETLGTGKRWKSGAILVATIAGP